MTDDELFADIQHPADAASPDALVDPFGGPNGGNGPSPFAEGLNPDQLDAVAGRMLFTDLPGTLSPFARKGDRGRTLEETWIRWTGGGASPLGRPIQSYAADERLGWRPLRPSEVGR